MTPRDCDSDRQSNLWGGRHECKSAVRFCDDHYFETYVLDDVFTDPRFLNRRSTLALEIAEHLLAQAAIRPLKIVGGELFDSRTSAI